MIEAPISQITDGQIIWRLEMIKKLASGKDENESLPGHGMLLLDELNKDQTFGQIDAIGWAGMLLTPSGIKEMNMSGQYPAVLQINDNSVVESASAYAMRVIHTGDAS